MLGKKYIKQYYQHGELETKQIHINNNIIKNAIYFE